MDESTLAFVKGVVVFVVLAATGMSYLSLRGSHRRREVSNPEEEMDTLREEHARSQAELQARVSELEERLDFVERRLVQEKNAPRLPEPRQTTPV